MNTTEEQRKAWQEVHKALINYIIKFGPIEVTRHTNETELTVYLDEGTSFPECGKMNFYCLHYEKQLKKTSHTILKKVLKKVFGNSIKIDNTPTTPEGKFRVS